MTSSGRRYLRRLGPPLLSLFTLGACAHPWQDESAGAAPSASAPAVVSAPVPRSPEGPPGPAPKGAMDLLGGLDVGADIDGWTVDRIVIHERELLVSFDRKGSGFEVRAGMLGVSPHLPPIKTEKYGVYYGFVREYGGPVPKEAPQRMAAEISSRIRSFETMVPVPAGL